MEAVLNDTTIIHRIGGGFAANLTLKPEEIALNPPGFSALLGGTPEDAAAQIRTAFPKAAKLHDQAKTVGSATIEAIRDAGFDVIPNPTQRLSNHVRVVHLLGAAGFAAENLGKLEKAFVNVAV